MTPEQLAQFGPLGATAFALALAVLALVKQRRGNGQPQPWDGIERRTQAPRVVLDVTGFAEQLKPLLDVRIEMKELREELVETRHEIRGDLQPLVTRVAVLEHRVGDLEQRKP